ncbi:MAG TPA: glycosyltransferase [Anaeromyxobacteraceae bacterium]|nr:glycosyltransferase [Anaeromyxobacteraceae bacterium]
MTSLSVLVPVYDEQHLVAASLERLEVLETSPELERVQVVVVDDSSRDRSPSALEAFARERGIALAPAPPHAPRGSGKGPIEAVERGRGRRGKIDWLFLHHARNGGKGAAVRTALGRAECALSVIHDADLEYHPRDILRIVRVFVEEKADAVFGSRFAGGESRRVLLFRHQLGNKLLTFLVNLATNLNLTDMETCYKAVRTDLLRSIPIVSDDFRLEPELCVKLAKREARLFEIPISYSGRTYQEGKKIGWLDGFRALLAILRFAFSDEVYVRDEHGSQMLGRLARAQRFNRWMADIIRPYCGTRLLEIGSGTGNLTRELVPRDRYVASDVNPLYLHTLENLTADRPYLTAQYTDVTELASYPRLEGGFDTVVCLNVIEHVDDDRASLENIRDVLSEDGRAVVLVPCGPWNFGSLDEVLGHKRRYTAESLRRVAAEAGFAVKAIVPFNRVSSLPWFLNGRILKRRHFGLLQIKAVNWLTPVFRLVDRLLPLPPLSLIAVLEPRKGSVATRAEIDLSRERGAAAK